MGNLRDLFGLVRRTNDDASVDEGVLAVFRQTYPGRRIEGGSGFVFVHPCTVCKHTSCGPECACACQRATVRP